MYRFQMKRNEDYRCDLSSMQTEAVNSDRPSSKRRWLQFRLRTLLIVVTLTAAGLAWIAPELRIARERLSMQGPTLDGPRTVSNSVVVYEIRASVPAWRREERVSWPRRLLGDRPVYEVWLGYDTKPSDVASYKAAFPEAEIHLGDPMNGDPFFHAF